MKKFFILFSAIFAFSTIVRAGVIGWYASDFSKDTYLGGTGYLIQAPASSSIQGIVDYLKNTGLNTTATGYDTTTFCSGKKKVVDEAGGYQSVTDSSSQLDIGSYSNLFFIVMNEDQTKFAISGDFLTIDVTQEGQGIDSYYYFNGSDSIDGAFPGWIEGDVAAVPEPTVLALLALGVAGVALRRKKVVA